MSSSSLSISGSFSSPPEQGTDTIGPYVTSNSSSPAVATNVALASGNNTVSISDQAVWVGILMEPNNTTEVIFRGAGDTTGVPISLSGFIFFAPLPGTGRSFVLNAAAGVTVRMLQG